MNSTKEIPLIFLVLILLLVQFYIFVDRRPFTDEGSYCTIAQAISQKMVLYRDVYNEKAPIPYFLLAPIINLNQNPILILRIISAISFGLATLILYHLLKLNGLSKLKAFAITVYFIITAPLFQSFNYTSEILALPLILFIIWQLSLNRMSKMNILCGFLTITLFFIKQPFILFILVISIFALFSYSVRRQFFKGMFVGLIVIVAALLISGSLIPFGENMEFLLTRYRSGSYFRLPYPNEYYQFILLCLLSVFMLYNFFKKNLSFVQVLLLLSLLPQGLVRMDAFKLLPFFTILILIISRESVIEGVKNFYIVMVILSILSIYFYRDIVAQRYDNLSLISSYIQSRTDERDSIWVGPHEANIYCLSHRRPSSKYFFFLPWIDRPEVILRIVDDITQNDPPRCIVDVSRFNNATDHSLTSLIPEFSEILKDYKDMSEIGGAVIYCKE
jgi:hypothetical protein